MLSFYWPLIKQAVDFIKKISLIVIVFLAAITVMLHFIQKDKLQFVSDNPIQRNRTEIYKFINDPELNKTTQGKFGIAIYRITTCLMIGEACTNNPNDGDKNFNHSLFGFFANLIILPYQHPPASGVYWAYSGLQNAGFIPKTYAAQGIGFGAIQPFSGIWVAFRDVSYTILVLIIIAIGFMIMFRMKLNPQTVISVENALPRIVLALILITFSFAIAGFLIDLMYITIGIIVSILAPVGGHNVAEYQQKYLQAGPDMIIGGLMKEGSFGPAMIFFQLPNAVMDLIPDLGTAIRTAIAIFGVFWLFPWIKDHVGGPIGEMLKSLMPWTVDAGWNQLVKATASFNLANFVGALYNLIVNNAYSLTLATWFAVTILAPLLVGLVIFISVVFIFTRILFMLFDAYGKVILNICIAPLLLLFEAIPGQSAFSSWFKNLVSELIVFPTVIAIFLIGSIMVDKASSGNMLQFPFLSGVDPKSFGLVLSMVILFMTPDLVKMVKQFFVPKPGPLDQVGIGVLFSGAKTSFEGGIGEVQKWGSIGYYVNPIQNVLERMPGVGGLFKREHR